jgi:hypothetical protein
MLSFTDDVDRSDLRLVRVIDGRSRVFDVLWLDHVARSRGHTNHSSDRTLQGCIIYALIDDGLTEV